MALTLAAVAVFAAAACGEKTSKIVFTFETNGGEPIASAQVDKGTEYTLPETAKKDGYGFDGWYDNADFTGEKIEKITAETSKTFYAKWAALYAVTLDLDGGTGVPDTVYLKAGENVKEGLSSYVPTKAGLIFGAWFNGDRELGANTRMPESGLSLKAKYKVEYTVNVYEQNLEDDDYTAAEPVKGTEYVDTSFAPEITRTGFDLVEKAGQSVSSLVLNADKSKNVFNLYFDRKSFSIHLFGNYDDAPSVEPIREKYGKEIVVPSDVFTRDGYYLRGWAKSSSGEIAYETGYIDTIVYNKDPDAAANVNKIVVTATENLYAVWSKAYVDMFGGKDYIYVLDETSGVGYLERGGVFFRGEFNPKSRELSFVNAADEEVLACRINDDYTFSYYDPSRGGEYSLYLGSEGKDDKTTVVFDDYNRLFYYENRGTANQQRSSGVFRIDESGDYVVTYDNGPHEGETHTIRLSTVTMEGVSDVKVFRIKNEEEAALGAVPMSFIMADKNNATYYGQQVSYTSELYTLTLSGFGVAVRNEGGKKVNYSYEKDGDKITLTGISSQTTLVVYLVTENNRTTYVVYNGDLDKEFTEKNGAYKLVLDGKLSATYTDADGAVHNGKYAVGNSLFGGYVVDFFETPSNPRSFLIRKVVENGGVIGEGEGQTVTYELELKHKGYAEHPVIGKVNGREGAYIPLLVLGDGAENSADIYGAVGAGAAMTFVKMAEGVYEETDDAFVYRVKNITVVNSELDSPAFDVKAYKSFTYAVESYSGLYAYYPIAAVKPDDTEESFSTRYVKGSDYLILSDNGYMVVSTGTNKYHGTYTEQGGIVTASITVNGATMRLYYEIGGGSFTVLDETPYSAYLLTGVNDVDDTTYIALDGKGGASFYESGVKKYDGTAKKTGETTKYSQKLDIFEFVSEDKSFSFRFIRLYSNNNGKAFYCPYNETYNDRYSSESDGQLFLDGFGYGAKYDKDKSHSYEGRYFIVGEDEIVLRTDDEAFYFDLDGRSFTVRGNEFGEYVTSDNRSRLDVFFAFDGYGKATVFTVDPDTSERTTITDQGVYTIAEDGLITVTYDQGSSTNVFEGKLGIYSHTVGDKQYREITKLRSEVVMAYVNGKDWSVLVLNDNGLATLRGGKGAVQTGTYVLITDTMLYFEDFDNVENGAVFNYDKDKGEASPVDNVSRGYYTSDLESLRFSQAGFAIFNGNERYYYSENSDKNVILYKKDASDPSANNYGFVEDDSFGKFETPKNYNGKVYYANNKGYAVKFNRADVDEEKDDEGNFYYPLPITATDKQPATELSFAPTGAGTFSNVRGVIRLGSKNYDCAVSREETVVPGEYVMYAVIGGAFRVEFTVDYRGMNDDGTTDSTFRVISVRHELTYNAFAHLNRFYQTYISEGQAAALKVLSNDTYGKISIIHEYDKTGTAGEGYVNAAFGEDSGMFDTDGETITLTKANYELVGNNTYIVESEIKGYKYHFYFGIANHSAVKANGYYIFAFTREEKIVTTDGEYEVFVERYVATDNPNTPKGSILRVGISAKTDDGEGNPVYKEIALSGAFTKSGSLYMIERTYEQVDKLDDEGNPVLDDEGNPVKVNGKVLTSAYYKIDLESAESLGEQEGLPTYTAVTVTKLDATVYNSADGKSFVEIFSDKTALAVVINGTFYFVDETSYEESTKTYTFTLAGGKVYTAVIDDDGVATFAEAE